MIPAAFEYHAPRTLQDAIAILERYPDDARLLAGGQSLVPMMKLRLAGPAQLVDLAKVDGLSYIQEQDGDLAIGAMTTYHALESSPLVRQKGPALAEAAGLVADVQVRNRGTIGGASAHADPAADLPAVLVAMEAQFRSIGPAGPRTIPADDFFVDMYTTALAPGEVLHGIFVPGLPPRTGSAYLKFANKASRFAIVGAVAVVTLAPDGRCQRVRIGITGAGPKAARAHAAERELEGKEPSPAILEVAGALASDGIEFLDDLHGSPEYREHLTQVLTTRVLTLAVQRAGAA